MIYIISCLSSVLSGMGIGGGSAFILLSILLNLVDINAARTYNLILFISTGIVTFFIRFKKDKVLNKNYFKTIFFILIGCVIGWIINSQINERILKVIFYVFMIIIGGYELIFSLIQLKKEKNN